MIAIEKMIVGKKANCVGCYACYNICPMQAITMREDEEGFRYPDINKRICISCGVCERACPSLNKHNINNEIEPGPDVYAAINYNEKIREVSSSGGIFTLLAEYVLQKGGIVFGAEFDENWEVHHNAVDKIDDLDKLRVSKYLQSRIENTYKDVRKELKTGREVLFVGTPCQAAGLKNFLRKKYNNLLVVDFICHGVPSPAVWREYLREKMKNKSEITQISFRDKIISWERYMLVFRQKNNRITFDDLNHDLYLTGFLQNLYLRPSCYCCKFCKKNRPVDITMADFWGVNEEIPKMYDGKGTSLVFVHTERGNDVIRHINMRKCKADFMSSIKYNPSMLQPSKPSDKRASFFKDFTQQKDSLCDLIAKYTEHKKISLKNRIKYKFVKMRVYIKLRK